MARPSMTALLALLAVAGYQNRDKLSEMLGGGSRNQGPPGEAGRSGGQQGGLAGMLGGQGGGLGGLFGGQGGGQAGGLGGLAGMLGGAGLGGLLSGGLRDIVDSFQKSGQGETAESWVRQGPNRELSPQELERAIGEDTLADLQQQTGLSRDELIARLTRELPKAVDGYTPDGKLPDA